jgi:two-component system OmpR family sensor kinase
VNLSRLSIRARITGGSLLIAILLSIAAGVVIYSQVERIVSDDRLRVLESVEGPYVTAIRDGDTDEIDPPGLGQFAAVVAPDGSVPLDTLPDALAEEVTALAARPDGVHVVGSGGETHLVKVTAVDGEGGEWHVVTAIGQDSRVLDQVALLLITSVALIALGFGAAAWLIGSAALGPVTRLRRSAEELAASPGDELLPVGPARDEISALADTLNELISGLRASAERERQIVSDASHEFRTPLAILQTRLELAQREAVTLTEMREDVAAAQKTLARLSALAASMLELSRIDAHPAPGRSTLAQLSQELADAADRGRSRVGGRDIRVDYVDQTQAGTATVAVGDADFGRVCDNLLGNALAAIGDTGSVELRLSSDVAGVRLLVTDDGGGMDPAYVPFAFDRFSRSSSVRGSDGAGLGLSIVAGIAANSRGTVALHNEPGVGVRAEVTFPFARR